MQNLRWTVNGNVRLTQGGLSTTKSHFGLKFSFANVHAALSANVLLAQYLYLGCAYFPFTLTSLIAFLFRSTRYVNTCRGMRDARSRWEFLSIWNASVSVQLVRRLYYQGIFLILHLVASVTTDTIPHASCSPDLGCGRADAINPDLSTCDPSESKNWRQYNKILGCPLCPLNFHVI